MINGSTSGVASDQRADHIDIEIKPKLQNLPMKLVDGMQIKAWVDYNGERVPAGFHPVRPHLGKEQQTLSGFRAPGIAVDHGVPMEDVGQLHSVEQAACVVEVSSFGCGAEGEDATGYVGVANEAEGDEMGVDLLQFPHASALL
ncbi:hypothetical protein ACLOJK_036765 [Asimina triloba]